MSDLRTVNARLRQVADKDELIGMQERLLGAESERSRIQDAELVKRLFDEVAELKRRLVGLDEFVHDAISAAFVPTVTTITVS